MKTGYSILLGEYIESEKINYTDCKAFQIVCPICKEPIFKVERKQSPSILHYLSHYEKSKAFAADCELRVNGISDSDIEKNNGQSRQQKLELFLSILREGILQNEFGSNIEMTKKAKQETIRWMNAPGVQIFIEMFRKNIISNNEAQDVKFLFLAFDDYIEDIESLGSSFPITGFSISTQKRITTDIWLHLLSANGSDNFDFLFCVAFGILSERIALAAQDRPLYEYEKAIMVVIEQLIEIQKNQAISMLTELAEIPIGPPHSLEGSNYLSKIASEINHEMFGILLRLPYFEILKNNKIYRK